MTDKFVVHEKGSSALRADLIDRWGITLAGGYVAFPSQLLVNQKDLGISPIQMVIILNLVMHWWTRNGLPYISAFQIAKRIGISRRTVERELKKMREAGLLTRVHLEISQGGESVKRTAYDLSALVKKLENLVPSGSLNSKMGQLVERRLEIRGEPLDDHVFDPAETDEVWEQIQELQD